MKLKLFHFKPCFNKCADLRRIWFLINTGSFYSFPWKCWLTKHSEVAHFAHCTLLLSLINDVSLLSVTCDAHLHELRRSVWLLKRKAKWKTWKHKAHEGKSHWITSFMEHQFSLLCYLLIFGDAKRERWGLGEGNVTCVHFPLPCHSLRRSFLLCSKENAFTETCYQYTMKYVCVGKLQSSKIPFVLHHSCTEISWEMETHYLL